MVYYAAGDFREALHVSRRVVAALEGKSVPARFGQLAPSAVTSRHIVALCLADMGAFAEGRVVAEEAVQMAEAVEQPYSIAIALHGVGFLYRRQGDLSHAIPVLQRSLSALPGREHSAVGPLDCLDPGRGLCAQWAHHRGPPPAHADDRIRGRRAPRW